MLTLPVLAALAMFVGLCALLARMAEEGLDWAPAGAPQGRPGWEPTQRRPAGWAHRLAQACKATARTVRAVAKTQARLQRADRLLAARLEARAVAEASIKAQRPAFAPAAPAQVWPPRPHARQPSGTWLVLGKNALDEWATPLAEGAWA